MSISLAKGQRLSLEKESGRALNKIIMGLGWDPVKRKGWFGGGSTAIDLDASCLVFNAQNALADAVWFGQLKSKDGSIVHTGDNRTGDGDGDDEQIIVHLSDIPASVSSMIFVINSFRGQTFDKIENAFCRIVDADNNKELMRYDLSDKGRHTGLIMVKIYRKDGGWKVHAIGEKCHGRTFHEMLPDVATWL